MLEQFTNFAIILDDKPGEVSNLRIELKNNGIYSLYVNPNNKDLLSSKMFAPIIFLDLHINETITELAGHISFIRKLLATIVGNRKESYGIVLWTKHLSEYEAFISKIAADTEYSLPLFVQALDKMKYSREGYKNIIKDIDKLLEKSFSAKFAIAWDIVVRQTKNDAIRRAYSLVPYVSEKQNENLKFILFKLAQSRDGIPLKTLLLDQDYSIDREVVKSLAELMIDNITNTKHIPELISHDEIEKITYRGKDKEMTDFSFNLNTNTFKNGKKCISESKGTTQEKEAIAKLKKEMKDIFTQLNMQLFFETDQIDSQIIMPGNIYKILDMNSLLCISHPIGSEERSVENPYVITPVGIVMNPPCDFAQDRIIAQRVLGGFLIENIDLKTAKTKFKTENYYLEINPVIEAGKEKILVFDFRYLGIEKTENLKNITKYTLFMRAKNTLFADILQKLTSHAARLGISVINE